MERAFFLSVIWTLLTSGYLGTSSDTHSLQYFYTLTLDQAGRTHFVSVGILDGVQIDHYDSKSQRDVPMVDWMMQGKRFWDDETKAREYDHGLFSAMMNDTFSHSSGGLHTFQARCECGFAPGRTWGGIRNAHNGQAFLTFDPESQSWKAEAPPSDQAAAVRVKRQWERWDQWTKDVKVYVDQLCPQRLHSFLGYGKKALEKKETPNITIVHTHTQEATCLATGYYPHGARVQWVRGERHEPVPEHMLQGGEELPNGDGTFQIRLTLRHLGEEEYKCQVNHSSMETPMMRTLEKPRTRMLILLSPAVIVVLITVMVVIAKWIHERSRHRDETDLPQETRL
ncbi:zinc-alpha-2-glycoprotein-like isoform X1 [Sardina pilchardus]|uniref:zinc-alpha-2-glycoprotein-like isoform X1 n=1 Tax=Sardina pilchardus TaxID=27697 RepID=UPI002E0EEAA7